MSLRHAVVAGQFYPGNPEDLRSAITLFFQQTRGKGVAPLEPGEHCPLLTMLPHAGYFYCGAVMAATLDGVELPRRLVILAPSHTGMGHPLGYWSEGAWETPLGDVPVDAPLGLELAQLGGGFTADLRPHVREHDIEVLLPFLQTVQPDISILPIVVGRPEGLPEAAHALAKLIRIHRQADASGLDERVALIVSSDMNHYADDRENRRRDALALEAFLALDPQRLVDVTQKHHISMCGILPALMGLLTCRELGASHARLAAYDTSATASGDGSRVVGYAGVHIW